MEKTRKFYSVKFRNWGADAPGTAWFDNKKDADEFYYSKDAADSPKLHLARSADTIAKYEEYCKS